VGISLLTIFQADRFDQLSSGATTPSAVHAALAGSYADVFLVTAALVIAAVVSALWLHGRVVPKGASGRPAAPGGAPDGPLEDS
jgi:hypothetical protein